MHAIGEIRHASSCDQHRRDPFSGFLTAFPNWRILKCSSQVNQLAAAVAIILSTSWTVATKPPQRRSLVKSHDAPQVGGDDAGDGVCLTLIILKAELPIDLLQDYLFSLFIIQFLNQRR